MSQLDRLAAKLARIERVLRDVVATPQLAHSSIVDGAVDQVVTEDTGRVDEYGNPVFAERVVSRYGQQGDGSNTVAVFDGPRPPRPVAPSVTGGPGFLSVAWSGEFVDRTEAYADHDYIGVHVTDAGDAPLGAATLAASIRSLAGETVVIAAEPGTWFVSLVAVSQAGIWSEPAPYSAGAPGEATGVDVTAREMAQAAQDAAAAAATVAVDARRGAAESRALAAAVSAAANIADGRAIDAAMTADVVLTGIDGKTRVTYSRQPPTGAAGSLGDTWFQVDAAGGVIGFWECTVGDGAVEAPEPVEVYPPAPTFEHDAGAVTIPATTGVTYLLAGRPVTPGTHPGQSGPVAVIATAAPGYRVSSDGATAWVETLGDGGETPPELIEVTPVAPTIIDTPGETGDRLRFPAVDGVTYWAGGVEVTAGDHPWSGTVRVTATAMPGYTLTPGAETAWSFSFTTTRTPVTPSPPTFTDPNGTVNDTVTVPAVAGVTYLVNGAVTPGGVHPASGYTEVTAAPAGDAWTITPGAETTWRHVYDTGSYATPTPPAFTISGYTIPVTEGVIYTIGGAPVEAGTYTASSALVSTDFTGTNGAAWPAPWVRGWGRTDQCQATIQAGRGQMRVAGTGDWSDKLWQRAATQRTNLDITYEVVVDGTSESWHHLLLRAQQAAEEPRDSYDVLFNRADVRLMRVVNWSSTTIGQSTAAGMALATTYRVRAQIIDTAIRVKLWPAAQTEPVGWLIDVTDSVWQSGYYGFMGVGGSRPEGYTHQVDNVVVTDPGGASTVTIQATPAPGWTLLGATSWSREYGA